MITFKRAGRDVCVHVYDDGINFIATPEDLRAAIEAMPESDRLLVIPRKRYADAFDHAVSRAETAESRLREVVVAASQEIAKQRQKAVTYGQRAQAYRDEAVRRGASPEWRPLVSGLSDERALQYALNSLPRPETTTMTEATEKNDGAQNVDMVVPVRVQPAAEKADEVAPSESAASEDEPLDHLDGARWLVRELERHGLYICEFNAQVAYEEVDDLTRIAPVERACIERGRAEARAIRGVIKGQRDELAELREQLAAKDREIAEARQLCETYETAWKNAVDSAALEAANLRSRLERSEQSRLDTKAELDAVARALHPHWPADGRNSYIANQLPGMIRLLREPNVVLKQKLVAAEREIAELRERIQTCITERDAKISELFDQTVEQRMQLEALEKSYRVVLPARPTPVEGNALQGYTPAREIPTGGQYVAPKPIQTSPFPSVAQESAKAWKVDPNVTREQVEEAVRKVVPERDWKCMPPDPTLPGGVRSTEALRKEIRGWLGDVKPSERADEIMNVEGCRDLAALYIVIDEIWTRAQGSK